MDRIRIEDLLVIAEIVLDIPADVLLRSVDVGMAESALAAPFASFDGHEFYVGASIKAAVLASRLVRNHPFIDGNKRVSLVTMIEFLRRNGERWPEQVDQDEVAETFERLAARDLSEADFAIWVASKLS